MSDPTSLNALFTLSRKTDAGTQELVASNVTGSWTVFHGIDGKLFAATLTIDAFPIEGAE